MTLRVLWWSVWRCATGVCLPFLTTSYAAVSVCDAPADYSHLSLAYYSHEETNVAGNGRVDLRSTSLDAQVAGSEAWTFGVAHRYDKFGFAPIELQTNGHLHSLFFPVHWQDKRKDQGFRVSVAPALTASSNVIKEPGEYSSDGFHFLAALIRSKQLSDKTTFRYGLCADTRFGEYALYPSISIGWQPHADWMVELGFPTIRVTYRATQDISSSLRIAPDGNEWYVKDKALQEESRFVYEAVLAEWTIDWQLHERFTITGSVGRQFDIAYEVTLLDGSDVQLAGDSVTRVGAALQWRF